ncbi:TIGR01777 family oxidoreductase [Olivibacter oleidegradans]|uniref:TIGR01777 family oxidoreductase n=1 Tax=Olivibacter oleidegradans TaxID=760123 RepID=A0ABV6HFY4_9SPHI
MKRILITGASGMVGEHLTAALTKKGYIVHALVRKPQRDSEQVKYFTWNVEEGIIDKTCIEEVDAIVHLAGENIGKRPWSKNVRTKILKSRTDSIGLIYKLLSTGNHQVKQVVSASGTGYYGNKRDELLSEDRVPADDFLGQTCFAWEMAVAKGRSLGLRTVSLRCGVVFAKEGGALSKIAAPIKLGLGATLGSGKQYIPWIHIQDAVNMYIYALEHPGLQGVYNMVAPEPVTNKQLNQQIAKILGKPLWLPPVPAFVLKSIMGKMSELLLDSAKVSPDKILNAGFRFTYPTIETALKHIFEREKRNE